MKRALLLAAMLPFLGGWACTTTPTKPPPPLAQCDAKCFQECVPKSPEAPEGDTGVRWEGDPNLSTTTDALGGEVLRQLVEKLLTCDTQHRKACAQCLERLDREGAIRL